MFFHPVIQQRARRCLFVTMKNHVAPPLIVYHWTLGFEDHWLGTVLYALEVTVCAHARIDRLMKLMLPILAAFNPNPAIPPRDDTFWPSNRVDSMFYATSLSWPSHHPQLTVVTFFDEAIHDSLMMGLTDGVLLVFTWNR